MPRTKKKFYFFSESSEKFIWLRKEKERKGERDGKLYYLCLNLNNEINRGRNRGKNRMTEFFLRIFPRRYFFFFFFSPSVPDSFFYRNDKIPPHTFHQGKSSGELNFMRRDLSEYVENPILGDIKSGTRYD